MNTHIYKIEQKVRLANGLTGIITLANTWYNDIPLYHVLIDGEDTKQGEEQIREVI